MAIFGGKSIMLAPEAFDISVDAIPVNPKTRSGDSSSDTSSTTTAAVAGTTPAVKIASPDLMINKDESVPIEIMTDLIFEDIGGQEIINIARTDLVNGQNVIYQPIKNLADINSQYNSKNILSLENTADTIFNNFPIRLDTHVPTYATTDSPNVPVYIDSSGNLIVEVINMQTGEQVEVQILTTGVLFGDTSWA